MTMRIMILTSALLLASCANVGMPDAAPAVETSRSDASPEPERPPNQPQLPADVAEAAPGPQPADPRETIEPARTVSESLMLQALISDDIRTDSVAVMGVVSGARQYCNLNWRNGFITFIQSLAESGEDVGAASDTHGIYSGVALQNLKKADYQCSAQDVASLEAISP